MGGRLKRWGLWALMALAFPLGIIIALLRGRREGVADGVAKERRDATLNEIEHADSDTLDRLLHERIRRKD